MAPYLISPDLAADEEVLCGCGAEEQRQLAPEYDHGHGGGQHEPEPGVEVISHYRLHPVWREWYRQSKYSKTYGIPV